MAARSTTPVAVLLALLVAACGGDKRDTTYRLGGVVSFEAGHVSDGDVADPAAPYHPNDTPEQAQAVAAGATIGGWVGAGADEIDWYRATLPDGQAIAFTVVEANANGGIGACLRAVSTPDTPIDCVYPDAGTATLTVPAQPAPSPGTADYFVTVEATAGESSYLLSLSGIAPAVAGPAIRLGAEFVPGDVVVRFRDAASSGGEVARAHAAAADLGLELRGRGHGAALLRAGSAAARARALRKLGQAPLAVEPGGAALDPVLDAKRETIRMIAGLRARADVESAGPNYVHHPTMIPNDPGYPEQWNYPAIRLPQAWDLPTAGGVGGAGVVVAVVDTGVFLAHPDLAGQLTSDGYDFISDAAAANDGDGIDSNPDDPGDAATIAASSFHGTHVSGTIAALTNNASGVAGVAFGAKVMPLRALGVNGGTTYDILQAIRYAAGLPNDSGTVPAKRADVVNLSLGCLDCYLAVEEATYKEVRDQGVLLVAAAGNEQSSEPSYPAAYPGVISVGAVVWSASGTPSQLASYSNTGPTIDLVAPGGDYSAVNASGEPVHAVLSTWVTTCGTNDQTCKPGGRAPTYAWAAGTSMAAPHVAGALALMKSACPTLSPAQVDYVLGSGLMTTPLGASPRNDQFGYGLLDATRAVQAALAQCNQPVPPALDVSPARLAFAPAQTVKHVTLARSGGDPGTTVQVTSAIASATWLSIAPETVDADGFGTYRVTADPTGLADGAYGGTVIFTASSGTSLPLPVSLAVGPVATGDGGGWAYVQLYVCRDDGGLVAGVGHRAGAATGGGFRYEFRVPAGQYCLVAGTDDDDDGAICDAGEACSMPATAAAPTPFAVSQDDLRHDLTLGFESLLPGSGGGAAAVPAVGLRRIAR